MIYNWNQTDELKRTHEISQDDKIIATAVTPKIFKGELNFNGEKYFIEHYEGGTFSIKKDNKIIGYIAEKFFKTGKFLCFDSGYIYHEIKVNDSIAAAFHVGLGRKGQYYQFNNNGETVGMIEKIRKVVNYRDKYILYVKDEKMQLMLLLFNLFLETGIHYNFMVAGEGNVVTNQTGRSAKEVREKYDENFINEVMENNKF